MSLFIGDQWLTGKSEPFSSVNPADDQTVWWGNSASRDQVEAAVHAARTAFSGWAALSFEQRFAIAQGFVAELEAHREELAALISREVGKPRWESLTEVTSMINKVTVSAMAYHARSGETVEAVAEATARLVHRPHGVLAVLGPYNFPGHLPNGHIVPALLAGNTLVFKPSEVTPAVGEWMVRAWQRAGVPNGVLNLVQGGRDTGVALANSDIDGLLFTGSYTTGVQLHRQFAGRPEVLLALEMGGNNPLIVWETNDLSAAALLVVQSAFLSAGQRCTCARRLIVADDETGQAFVAQLLQWMDRLRVGPWDADPPPFMGPVIHQQAAQSLLAQQQQWLDLGARPLRLMTRCTSDDAPFLRPGLIEVTGLTIPDEEAFGPLLQLIRVPNFATAIRCANQTRFGLSAGLISDNATLWNEFSQQIRAGVVNWNRPLTGASSRAPFGGVGWSGNHRPSALYAADYCAYPVASLMDNAPKLPTNLPLGIEG